MLRNPIKSGVAEGVEQREGSQEAMGLGAGRLEQSGYSGKERRLHRPCYLAILFLDIFRREIVANVPKEI
jgi:hypothetical protein